MRLSVVIPCKNEVATIEQVLRDLAEQTLDEAFEVVVADGFSDDGTRELLARLSSGDLPYRLRVVDNPSVTIPSGLNVAVREASGKYIVRIDGHCRLSRDYLELLLDALQEPGRDVVGPSTRYIPGAGTGVAADIALALGTRLGTGGTPSRGDLREAVRVDHTVMSCYRREVWETIGGYNESLLSNEDFDFDYRANLHGFEVWSLPRPQYLATARTNLRSLLRQRLRYGYWKWQVIKRYPRSLRARQLIPPAITVAIGASIAPVFWIPELLVVPVAYALLLSLYAAREKSRPCWWRLASVYAVIHLGWGLGLLRGVISQPVSSLAARARNSKEKHYGRCRGA